MALILPFHIPRSDSKDPWKYSWLFIYRCFSCTHLVWYKRPNNTSNCTRNTEVSHSHASVPSVEWSNNTAGGASQPQGDLTQLIKQTPTYTAWAHTSRPRKAQCERQNTSREQSSFLFKSIISSCLASGSLVCRGALVCSKYQRTTAHYSSSSSCSTVLLIILPRDTSNTGKSPGRCSFEVILKSSGNLFFNVCSACNQRSSGAVCLFTA